MGLKRNAWIIFVVVAIALPRVFPAFVGVDTTTQSYWRTAAALEADNEYGTDGYVIYGLKTGDSVYTDYDASSVYAEPDNLFSLPAYIDDISLADATYMWSGSAAGNFDFIEDPSNGNALTPTPLLANGDPDPWVFTITRNTAAAFRLTVMLSNGDAANSRWIVDVDDGGGPESYDFNVPNTSSATYYVVFDIAAGSGAVTVTVEYITGTPAQFNVSGFAFDPMDSSPPSNPDPGSDQVIFDFETGDMQDWRIVEGSFGMFVCNRESFHNQARTAYNKQGTYFLSSLETPNYTPNDGYTGTAESPVFKLIQPEISFLVGGGNNSSVNYIALCTVDQDLNEKEVFRAYGADTEVMRRISWNVPELVDQTVFIRLRDHATGGWGHVTFDDFSASGRIDNELTAKRWTNLPLPIDMDAARQVVLDLMNTYPAEKYDGQAYLDQFDNYEQQLVDMMIAVEQGSATQAQLDQLIEDIEAYIRRVLIANPLVSGQPILYIVRDQYHPTIHHNTATFKPNYDNEYDDGHFRPGGAMKTIDFGNGGIVTTLIETPHGLVRDPEVYFDGSKIVFAKRDSRSDNFNIYEINADGSGLTVLTWIDRVTDIDPMYLPDDSIVFSSTREPKYVHCNVHIMGNLYRMEADGANIHQISKNTLFDFQPSLTPDGQIIYTRWEYVDRNFGDAQGIWTCNPDGTKHATYWGNNTRSPAAVVDPRIIPGTQQLICTFTSCHDRPWGAIAVIDRRLGLDLPQPNKPNPVKYIWPESAIDECYGWDGTGNVRPSWLPPSPDIQYPFDNMRWWVTPKYEDPYPLYDPNYPLTTGKYFLCSRMINPSDHMGGFPYEDNPQTGIYLLDIFGNEILLHTELPGCYDPMPLGPRPRPPQIPTWRNYNENAVGKFYLMNAYEGTHMAGVAPGSIKYLRVVEATKKLTRNLSGWGGQGGQPPGMAWHAFYSKNILGTVPIEEDGSAYFTVPAETFVYFQLLDENGQMIQSMRSGTLVQPGEYYGCIGCHESRTESVPVPADYSYLPMAVQRDPCEMNGWRGSGTAHLFNYIEDTQPVLTSKCASCHGLETRGGPEGGLNLSPDTSEFFNISYNEIWRKGYSGGIGAGPPEIQQPYSWGSHASGLLAALSDPDHAQVTLTDEEFERIVTWLDLNAPFYTDYTCAYPSNPTGRCLLTQAELNKISSLTGAVFDTIHWDGYNRGPQISFDRPDLSPCLDGVTGSAYTSALSIIQTGQSRLISNPRVNMPGHVPNAGDILRLDKYDMRKAIELLNRQAIREGWKNYD